MYDSRLTLPLTAEKPFEEQTAADEITEVALDQDAFKSIVGTAFTESFHRYLEEELRRPEERVYASETFNIARVWDFSAL